MLSFIIFFIVVFVIFNIMGTKSNKNDINNSKTYTGIKIGIGIIIILIGIFYAYTNHFGPILSNAYDESADGFTIEKFDVDLNVNKDNKVDVTETLYISFFEDGKHGIFRYVPTWLKYTGKDGDTISRQSKITNLKVDGYEYTVDDVSQDKKRIKIGSANKILDIGLYKYIITYTYDMGEDPFNGFDEFIFHAYGDFWGTEIKNASINVTLPERYDGKVNFFADKLRKDDITNMVDYTIEGNTIRATVKDSYKLMKSLTIDIELPEGYFNNTSNNNKMIISILLVSILLVSAIILTLILYNRWQQFGKEPLDKVETVEFYPPGNLDPAQMGYIYKKDTGRKLTISLIVSLASKGYIKIDEIGEKKKKKIVITNTNVKDTAIGLRRIVVEKYDIKDMTSDEKELLDSLDKDYFKNDNKVKIESITNSEIDPETDVNTFLKKAQPLIDKNYLKILEDVVENPKTGVVERYNEADTKKILEKMSHAERIVYDYIFKNGENEVVLEENKSFYKAFGEVNNFISSDIENRINNVISYKEMSKSALIYICNSLLVALTMYSSTIYNNYKYIIFISGLALLINLISLILTLITRRKTEYGVSMIAKIKGFKNYLLLAEKEQLEDQVEKNPHYFYDILPYAYVLGVSKKWIEKFEKLNIEFPRQEGIDLLDYHTFDSIGSSVYYPPSSSGSSGCGGGCSSCGGGCSSCGGGGSW